MYTLRSGHDRRVPQTTMVHGKPHTWISIWLGIHNVLWHLSESLDASNSLDKIFPLTGVNTSMECLQMRLALLRHHCDAAWYAYNDAMFGNMHERLVKRIHGFFGWDEYLRDVLSLPCIYSLILLCYSLLIVVIVRRLCLMYCAGSLSWSVSPYPGGGLFVPTNRLLPGSDPQFPGVNGGDDISLQYCFSCDAISMIDGRLIHLEFVGV